MENKYDCHPVQVGESELERYAPAISTIGAADNEAVISFKILSFIKNQAMFAEWNWINWQSLLSRKYYMILQ